MPLFQLRLSAIDKAVLLNIMAVSGLLKATSLVDYATEKLHAYPYKEVPICWRRLYTDASLVKGLCEIFMVCRTEKEKETWIEMGASFPVRLHGIELCRCNVDLLTNLFRIYLPPDWQVSFLHRSYQKSRAGYRRYG